MEEQIKSLKEQIKSLEEQIKSLEEPVNLEKIKLRYDLAKTLLIIQITLVSIAAANGVIFVFSDSYWGIIPTSVFLAAATIAPCVCLFDYAGRLNEQVVKQDNTVGGLLLFSGFALMVSSIYTASALFAGSASCPVEC